MIRCSTGCRAAVIARVMSDAEVEWTWIAGIVMEGFLVSGQSRVTAPSFDRVSSRFIFHNNANRTISMPMSGRSAVRGE